MDHTKAATGPNKTIEPPAESTNASPPDVMNVMHESLETGINAMNSGVPGGSDLAAKEIAASDTMMNTLNQGISAQQNQALQQLQNNVDASISKLPPDQQAQARQELQTMEQLLGGAFKAGG